MPWPPRLRALPCTAFATAQHHPGARTTLSAACDDSWVPYLMHLTRLCWRSARLSGPDFPTSSSRDCAHSVCARLRRLLATCASHAHAQECPARLLITLRRSHVRIAGWGTRSRRHGGALVFWPAPLRLLDAVEHRSGCLRRGFAPLVYRSRLLTPHDRLAASRPACRHVAREGKRAAM